MANTIFFEPQLILDFVPDGEIWEDWKFVGFAGVIWNFGILGIRFKSEGILPNQTFWYYDKKPIVNKLPIYWKYHQFTNIEDIIIR
jgi:hypothetical protein